MDSSDHYLKYDTEPVGGDISPDDWYPQYWIIVIEALAQWSGPPTEPKNPRRERAYELIDEIAEIQGLSPGDLVRQADGGS